MQVVSFDPHLVQGALHKIDVHVELDSNSKPGKQLKHCRLLHVMHLGNTELQAMQLPK